MDNSNMSKNRANEHLGVNKMGKNIRKSPLHQPNFSGSGNDASSGNNTAKQQPQPQVYNVSKNDFRNVVQQLTGSPLHSQEPLPPRPPTNPPKHPSNRLQRIRPPPLTPIARPPIPNFAPVPAPAPAPAPMHPPMQRPPMHPPMQRPPMHPPMQRPPMAMPPAPAPMQPPMQQPPMAMPPAPGPAPMHPPMRQPPMAMPPAQFLTNNNYARQPLTPDWLKPALSPISQYMQQLQRCIDDPWARPSPSPHALQPVQGQAPAPPPQWQSGHEGQYQPRAPPSGLPQNPPAASFPSPRMNNYGPLPSPNSQFWLPSPTLPSPSVFLNMLSPTPRSPYPLLSPGSSFPPPLSPNFSFTPMAQPGTFGPGPQPPFSPGAFPLSPSAIFPVSSPRWRHP